MDKNSKSSTFIIFSGVLILAIFAYISAINILPNNSSDSFFSKEDDGLNAIIKDITLENSKLNIKTSNSDAYVCTKQTKSKPNISSICWKQVNNNEVTFSVYTGKTYYIWLKDNQNQISDYTEYNTNIKKIVK